MRFIVMLVKSESATTMKFSETRKLIRCFKGMDYKVQLRLSISKRYERSERNLQNGFCGCAITYNVKKLSTFAETLKSLVWVIFNKTKKWVIFKDF